MASLYGADLAYVHHAGFRDVPEAAARWLAHYLATHTVPAGPIVDLGCGSGVFAAAMAETTRGVIGYDASGEMIALARATAPGSRFHVGTIEDVSLPACAIVALVGEGLNYVPPGGRAVPLDDLLGRVRATLPRRGLLFFDVITGTVDDMVGSRGSRTGTDWAVMAATCRSDVPGCFQRRITTFRAIGGHYRRSDECHLVRVLDRAAVTDALRSNGFSVRTAPGYEPETRLPHRTVFVARAR